MAEDDDRPPYLRPSFDPALGWEGTPLPSGHMFIATIQARAALRRLDGNVDRLPGSEIPVMDAVQITGDLGQAVLSLYLAASAAHRCCAAHGEAGPVGIARLTQVLATVRAMRDAVMHWDSKLRRDPCTFLEFSPREILLYAPPRPGESGPSRVDGLLWTDFREIATRLDRWASPKAPLPLGPESSVPEVDP